MRNLVMAATGFIVVGCSAPVPQRVVGPLPVVPRHGYLDVEVPRTVSLDGVVQGQLPTTVDVPAGHHELEVKIGVQSLIRKPIDADTPTQVPVSLPMATLTIDHRAYGGAPLMGLAFEPGEHLVEIDVDGVGRAQHTVTIVEGKLTGVTFDWYNGRFVATAAPRPIPPNPYAPVKQ